jgi:hypothetical protein
MNWTEEQTLVDISGTEFPKVQNNKCSKPERFWFVKDEFIRHSKRLLNEGKMFSSISAHLVGNRWECVGHPITDADVAAFVWTLRLFYMKSECMSIDSVSSYLEHQVKNDQVKKFYKHMRESWESYLNRDAQLDLKGYNGPVKTNKNLINTLLYSGNFHSQEKYKNRYDELLEYMDESLIFMNTYNAMHGSYQMNQISRSLKCLREDNLIILLPNHLRHEWDENSPYMIVK